MERGVKFSRKPKLTPYQQNEVRGRFARGDTQTAIAKRMGVDQTTINGIAVANAVMGYFVRRDSVATIRTIGPL